MTSQLRVIFNSGRRKGLDRTALLRNGRIRLELCKEARDLGGLERRG